MVLEALAVALLAHYSLKSAMKSFFIDVNDDVIHLINKEKTYPQIIMNEEQPVHWIKNIRAVDGKDPEAVSNEIADADIMATALGAAVLEKVAPVIAQGL